MNSLALAALVVVAAWWISTGVVLRLVWLRRATFSMSLAAASALGIAGAVGAIWSSQVETVAAAYLGFGCALAVWGWHELTFLLGKITGPRKTACPPGAEGWARFRCATETVIHHEIALAVTTAALVGLTWGAPNQVATGTFLVLWVMRLSAKLNIFLGVRNVTEEFVPARLRYLISYFRTARRNFLMPFSIFFSGVAVVALGASAVSAESGSFAAVGYALVATILAIALIEHLFLILPLPDALLWRWIVRASSGGNIHDNA